MPCSGGHRLIWAAVRERESRGARGEREPESERASGSRGVAEDVQGDEGGSRRWKQEVALGRGRVDTPLPTGRG